MRSKEVRNFEYRPCRFSAGFELEFVSEGKTIFGLAEDISDDGICATLDGKVKVGSFGTVRFPHSSSELELEAQVAYINRGHVGLAFLFATPWEQEMLRVMFESRKGNTIDSRILPFG
jgi:hypothetical protein